MTLMDAQVFDEVRSRRRKIKIATAVFVVLVLAWLIWTYRNWPEERVVESFFLRASEADFEGAYGVWMHDPQWRQHPQQYQQYPYNEFYRDWGPGANGSGEVPFQFMVRRRLRRRERRDCGSDCQ